MDLELQNELYKKYPKIFRQKDDDMTSTCMCWGFECGNGWYNIIDTLCLHIQNLIDRPAEEIARYEGLISKGDLSEDIVQFYKNKIEEEKGKLIDQIEATQVKEKYGSLRFYTNIFNEDVEALISFAESLSEVTCEKCGSFGKPNEKGWIVTLCDKCRG